MCIRIGLVLTMFIYGFSVIAQKAPFTNTFDCFQNNGTTCDELLLQELKKLESTLAPDSLFKVTINGSLLFAKQGYFEPGLLLAKQAFEVSDMESIDQIKALARLSAIYLFQGSLDSSLKYVERALSTAKQLNDSMEIGRLYLNRGQVKKEMANYPKAMEDYMEAIQWFEGLGSIKLVARTKSEMASLFAVTNEVEKAIAYNKSAATLFKSLGQTHRFAYSALNMANDLIYTGRSDTAMLVLQELIPIFRASEDVYLEMNAEAQLGRAYFKLGDTEQAIKHFSISNKMGESHRFVAQLAYNHEFLSRVYTSIHQSNLALSHALKSYELHQQLGFNEELSNALHDLAIAFENTGQLDSAVKYYLRYFETSDSLFSIDKEHELDALKAKFQAEVQAEQIESGKVEIAFLEQKHQAQLVSNIALGLCLIMVLLIAIWVITRQRVRMKLQRKLNEEKRKTLQAELVAKAQAEELLLAELTAKKRTLTGQALAMAEKNEMLHSLKNQLNEIAESQKENSGLRQLVNKFERAESQQQDWDKFMHVFNEVHPTLLVNMKKSYATLTANDLRLIALMRMNFSNKEIASILHISDESLKKARYRLRKKLTLPSTHNIFDFVMKQ